MKKIGKQIFRFIYKREEFTEKDIVIGLALPLHLLVMIAFLFA